MIEFKNISKSYLVNKQTVLALDGINLMVNRGEVFGIFGESGAGKSTLLRMINLLEQPNAGKMFIAGVELTALSKSDLNQQRRRIGMIFQHFNLLQSRTAYENIALPLELVDVPRADIDAEVTKLLALVRLTEHQHHYPQQLSGGQQQRVAIARALATKPHILLCDEATSALDPTSTQSILQLLKEINQQFGVTIILITHELEVIKQICDRAAVLDRGQLVEIGSVVDLFARPKSVVTRQLVQKSMHLELPRAIKRQLRREADPHSSRLVRFTFVGDDSNQPLMTNLVQKFNVTINIIQANIENIQDETVGFTVCQLSGEPHAIENALASIQPSSITAEILGYV